MHQPEIPGQADNGRRRIVTAALVTVLVVGTLLVGVLFFGGRGRQPWNALGVHPTPAPATTSALEGSPAAQSDNESVTAEQRRSPSGQATRAIGAACDGTPLAAPAASDLAAVVTEVARQHGATVTVSWLDPAQGIVTVGELTNLPAWSTAKVPLALAVIANGDGEALRPTILAALSSSSNEAADTLWQSLGPDDQIRSQAVTALFRQAGDQVTTVPAQQLLPPYSVFGQTQWSTAAQLEFLQMMPCLTGAGQVMADMAAVVAAQRWGLGTKDNAIFKGGWGPSAGGGQMVRQFGWYTDHDGVAVPVAIAIQSNSFDAGVAVMNDLATALG